MTKQLRLMDTQAPARRPSPSRAYGQLDEHTRELGLAGVRQAREALAEANRRVAVREAERLERRDNELAERSRSARRARLRLTVAADSAAASGTGGNLVGSNADNTDPGRSSVSVSDSPTSPPTGTAGHRSAA